MPISRTGLAGRHTLLHLELQLLNLDANGKFTATLRRRSWTGRLFAIGR